jgi:hypothetical protein
MVALVELERCCHRIAIKASSADPSETNIVTIDKAENEIHLCLPKLANQSVLSVLRDLRLPLLLPLLLLLLLPPPLTLALELPPSLTPPLASDPPLRSVVAVTLLVVDEVVASVELSQSSDCCRQCGHAVMATAVTNARTMVMNLEQMRI